MFNARKAGMDGVVRYGERSDLTKLIVPDDAKPGTRETHGIIPCL